MKKIVIITIFIGLLFGFWQTAQALLIDYPDIPGAGKLGETSKLPEIIRYIYMFSLGAVGIVALLSILIGALQYVTSAGNPTKMGEAKDRIFSALLGILILLASVMILRTINPDLIKLGIKFPTTKENIPDKEEEEMISYKCLGCCMRGNQKDCTPHQLVWGSWTPCKKLTQTGADGMCETDTKKSCAQQVGPGRGYKWDAVLCSEGETLLLWKCVLGNVKVCKKNSNYYWGTCKRTQEECETACKNELKTNEEFKEAQFKNCLRFVTPGICSKYSSCE